MCGWDSQKRTKREDEEAWRETELSAWEPVTGDWRAAERGALPGGGQWPTVNGSPGNSMNTGESQVPAAGAALRLQWFGEPFATDSIDRHAVPMTPLFKNGIAVIPNRRAHTRTRNDPHPNVEGTAGMADNIYDFLLDHYGNALRSHRVP